MTPSLETVEWLKNGNEPADYVRVFAL